MTVAWTAGSFERTLKRVIVSGIDDDDVDAEWTTYIVTLPLHKRD
jgi:hypothetical protein